jgi:hypothetical protein
LSHNLSFASLDDNDDNSEASDGLIVPSPDDKDDDRGVSSIGGMMTGMGILKYLDRKLSSCHLFTACHVDCPGIELEPPWLEVSDYPPELWLGPYYSLYYFYYHKRIAHQRAPK